MMSCSRGVEGRLMSGWRSRRCLHAILEMGLLQRSGSVRLLSMLIERGVEARLPVLPLVRRRSLHKWASLPCDMGAAVWYRSVVEGRGFEDDALAIALALPLAFDAVLAYWSLLATCQTSVMRLRAVPCHWREMRYI